MDGIHLAGRPGARAALCSRVADFGHGLQRHEVLEALDPDRKEPGREQDAREPLAQHDCRAWRPHRRHHSRLQRPLGEGGLLDWCQARTLRHASPEHQDIENNVLRSRPKVHRQFLQSGNLHVELIPDRSF